MRRAALSLGTVVVVVLLVGCGGGGNEAALKAEVAALQKLVKERAAPDTEAEVEPEGAGSNGAPTATTIPDGTWARGEYTPGTYRARGGAGCYWEKEKRPDVGMSGLGNGVDEANPLLEIDSPYFKTEGCGVWRKVG